MTDRRVLIQPYRPQDRHEAMCLASRLEIGVAPWRDPAAVRAAVAGWVRDSLVARGVKLRVGVIVFDPADPMGKMFFNILATFAEFEVDLLRLRTKEGMAIAKANGKLKGKPPKLNPCRQAHLIKLHHEGSHGIPELADPFSVSRATVYRALDKARHHTGPAKDQPAAARTVTT